MLVDLRERLARTRWPGEVADIGWRQGTELGYLRRLCEYWRERFDWREQERRLNELPQFRVCIDGLDIHFVHLRGRGPNPLPLILTHGWPSSFAEFVKLAPLLIDPAAHGGSAEDSFDLVVPSLPGYGFSAIPSHPFAAAQVPKVWASLMRGLGYERFGAHGGDLGGGVCARLGQQFPEHLVGIHVTNVYGPAHQDRGLLSASERTYLEEERRWDDEEGGYAAIQSTRPQTLAYGLTDSPAGLAAWIVEKHRAWSDCGAELERAIARDELLTNLTIYWATGTIASSLRFYWDARHNPNRPSWTPIRVPTAVAVFPGDIARPPREYAERSYAVRRFTEMPRGGHFPALEQPELLAADIREFFRDLR